jgi:hypothetical protein
MITGFKLRRADEPGADARKAGPIALIVALAVGIALAVSLMKAPVTRPDLSEANAARAYNDD